MENCLKAIILMHTMGSIQYMGCKKLKSVLAIRIIFEVKGQGVPRSHDLLHAAVTEWNQCVCCLEQWQCVGALEICQGCVGGVVARC